MPVAASIYYYLSKFGGGDRLPVVLIHGAGGTHLHWPSEIRRLLDLRLFAVDLPGHGKSGQYGLQTIEAYSESILSWMEAIKLHRAVFVGHSMGGAIALTLAKKHAERVLGLSLFSTGARLRVNPILMENFANIQTFPNAISLIISKSFSKDADARLVKLSSNRMTQTRPAVLHGDFTACNNFDMLDSLTTIKTPTLVVCGQNDEMTPLRYSQYLKDHIPGSQLSVIPTEILGEFLHQIRYQPGSV
jgi:pimeloyl-ACP methyl ester carboxylesterase